MANDRYRFYIESVQRAALEALEDGRTRFVCPVCLGGNAHEESASIWQAPQSGGHLVTCHRASCSVGTVPLLGGSATADVGPRKPSVAHRMEGAPLDEEDILAFNAGQQFTFSKRALAKYVRKGTDGWQMLQFTSAGILGGHVYRPCPKDGSVPVVKSLTLRFLEKWDGMGWYVRGILGSRRIVVVEDPRSALAILDAGGDAVSLNGTSFGESRFDSIRRNASSITLMLDADATEKAIAYRLRYGQEVSVHRLSRDVKNMPREDVVSLLRLLV